MSIEANKALARAAIAVWRSGDESGAGTVFAPGYVMHQHQDPDGEGDLTLAALLRFVLRFRQAFSDLQERIDLQIAEGELVATRFTAAGTHSGSYQGIAPTGRRLSWSGMVIDRITEGRIVESWGTWDMLGMLQQMGATVRLPAGTAG